MGVGASNMMMSPNTSGLPALLASRGGKGSQASAGPTQQILPGQAPAQTLAQVAPSTMDQLIAQRAMDMQRQPQMAANPAMLGQMLQGQVQPDYAFAQQLAQMQRTPYVESKNTNAALTAAMKPASSRQSSTTGTTGIASLPAVIAQAVTKAPAEKLELGRGGNNR